MLLLALVFVQVGCAEVDDSMVGKGDPAAVSSEDQSHGWGVSAQQTGGR